MSIFRHSPPGVDGLLDCAVKAAITAGRHALRNARRRFEVVQRAAHDVKLTLDGECQSRAERIIGERFPEHAIRGEESAARPRGKPSRTRIEWIIDPIDGTVNFSHGLPFWACSVAATCGGQTIAAAVYAPAWDELFTAAAGWPAKLNGRPIRVSRVNALSRSIVLTGLDKRIDPRLPPFEIFRAISAGVQKARVLGSASLDICHVACGRADGYFETGIYIWDIAAGRLILQQAGGKAEILRRLGGDRLQFIATNGLIHHALKSLIRRPAASFV